MLNVSGNKITAGLDVPRQMGPTLRFILEAAVFVPWLAYILASMWCTTH